MILRDRSIRIIGAVVMVVQLNSNNLKNILRVLVRSMFHQEEEQPCCSTTTRYLYRTANHSQTERDIYHPENMSLLLYCSSDVLNFKTCGQMQILKSLPVFVAKYVAKTTILDCCL